MRMADKVIDIIYPRRCPVCDDIVNGTGAYVCDECRDVFCKISEPRCMKCGSSLSDETQILCGECSCHEHFFDSSRAAFIYDDMLKESIYRFKYGGRAEYADYYAAKMGDLLHGYIMSCRAQALIPIPLHKSRLAKRGYNQAELIARRLSDRFDIPLRNDILKRQAKTAVQKSLSASQRQNNLKKAFKIASDVVKLNNIILVDDIFTTGSTIDAAARCLKEAGVMNVFCLVLAVADIG